MSLACQLVGVFAPGQLNLSRGAARTKSERFDLGDRFTGPGFVSFDGTQKVVNQIGEDLVSFRCC